MSSSHRCDFRNDLKAIEIIEEPQRSSGHRRALKDLLDISKLKKNQIAIEEY